MSAVGQETVVIGAGAAGLTTALLLARLGDGSRVTVIDRNPEPGGLMRSFTRGGVACSVGVHYISAFAPGQPLRQVYDALGVTDRIPAERMGTGPDGIIDRYVFDDLTFDLPSSFEAYERALLATFPSEGAAIRTVIEALRDVGVLVNRLDSVLPTNAERLPIGVRRSCKEVFADAGCSRALRGVLSVPTALLGVSGGECPFVQYAAAHASYLLSAWRLRISGAQMADVLVDRLRALGGTLVSGEEVGHIEIADRCVTGVITASGRRIPASTVVAAVHPKILAAITAPGALRPAYRSRVERLRETPGVVVVHAIIDGERHPPQPHNTYRVWLDEEGLARDSLFLQLLPSGRPGQTLLIAVVGSEHRAWEAWAQTQTGRRGPAYAAAKARRAEQMLDEAARVLGDLRLLKTLDCFTPLSLRDWVGSPLGGAYGISRSARRFIETATLHRTGIGGLHLTGQSALAPGILGVTLGAVRTAAEIAGRAPTRAFLGLGVT